MSVSSRILTGWTVEILDNVTHPDFAKFHAFIDMHPELDEYNYKDVVGQTLLIVDGMNGHYLRLMKIDACQKNAYFSASRYMTELKSPELPDDILSEFQKIYKEYTGTDLQINQIKYTMWTQWT